MFAFGVILVRIFPVFSLIRNEYGEILRISPYSVRMPENAGKMRTRITPYTDTFYAVWDNCVIKIIANFSTFFSVLTMGKVSYATAPLKNLYLSKLFLIIRYLHLIAYTKKYLHSDWLRGVLTVFLLFSIFALID